MRRLTLCLCLLAAAPAWAQAPDPPASPAPSAADAWAALAAGQARPAEIAFLGLAADAGPAQGGPLLGAGLAAAATGHTDRAVQRVRLALTRDPSAFRSLPAGGPALRSQIESARASLEAGLLESGDPSGVLLASGALDYLLGELPTARLSLAAAVRRDGLQPAMRSLDRLLQEAALSEREGTFVPPVLAQAPLPRARPEPEPEPAAPATPASPPVAVPPESSESSEPPQPPRLLRPVEPASTRARSRPEVFFDYERLNLRVSEMAGSLQSFEDKLLQSLMTRPATPPADAALPSSGG